MVFDSTKICIAKALKKYILLILSEDITIHFLIYYR
jgi:hypothetical protein